jgi:hypothetical protein
MNALKMRLENERQGVQQVATTANGARAKFQDKTK